MNKVKAPSKFGLYFIKDSTTSQDFIREILLILFDKTYDEYLELYSTLQVNNEVLVGKYIKEIAILKKELCFKNAENYNFPFVVELRKEDN